MADVTTVTPTTTSSALAKLKIEAAQKSSTILGSGASILNMSNSLLDNGRAIGARNGGTGLSSSSRQLLEGFFNNASAIFNQLYTKAENGEATNIVQIKALRSKYSYVVEGGPFDEKNTNVTPSENGTNVDTEI